MNTQSAIMELLNIEPMGVNDLASKTATSTGYIRTQLKAMEAARMVERVDNRMPFIYKVAPKKDPSEHTELIATMKIRLMGTEKDSNPIVELIKTSPRKLWEPLITSLVVMSAAIQELKDEGKLVDTL